VSLLGGYEKSRSYTKVFVTNDVGISVDALELHRPIKIPKQSVTVNAQVNTMKRRAERFLDGGRDSFSDPMRMYCGDEKVNGIFISPILTMKRFRFPDVL
jgi:hypothetical protein